MNSQHHPTIRFEHFNFRFDGQHGAHLGPVADRVPKVLAKMFRFHWCEPDCFKCAVFAFFDTKQDDTAIGVGEGGIGLPTCCVGDRLSLLSLQSGYSRDMR